MITIYTLKSCDTCKKALKWLEANNIAYQNHDVRADDLTAAIIEGIVENLGWEVALNRRSTTWRGLSEDEKTDITNAKAVDLIKANPTLMKRPVFVKGTQMFAGFTDEMKSALAG